MNSERGLISRLVRRLVWACISCAVMIGVCAAILYYLHTSGTWSGGWTATVNNVKSNLHQGVKGLGKLVGKGLGLLIIGYIGLTLLDEMLGGGPPPPPNGYDPRYRNDPRYQNQYQNQNQRRW